MNYQPNYEPRTMVERDRALTWFRQQARQCHRLINRQQDTAKTPLAPNYTPVLIKMLDTYRETINRLAKWKVYQPKEKV